MNWLLALTLFATTPDVSRQVRAHQLVGEHQRAVEVAHAAIQESPPDAELYGLYVGALAGAGYDCESVEALGAYLEQFPDNPELTEQVAWAALQQGALASAAQTRLAALIGAAMTRDAMAVPILIEGMQARNRALRCVALGLAPTLRDAPLKAEVEALFRTERVFEVRLAAIGAVGSLQLTHLLPELEAIIAGARTSDEERLLAIAAVVEMLDGIDPAHLQILATNKRAGLRQLACEIVTHLDLTDQLDQIIPLLNDPIPQVRVAALAALGLLRAEGVEERVRPLLEDHEPSVAITAAYVMTLLQPEEGMEALRAHLRSRRKGQVYLAASALAHTGFFGLPLAREVAQSHPDPIVRANVAMGLIGQREGVETAAETLYALLQDQTKRWMSASGHPLFQPLVPSTVRRGQGGGPEVVDQITRLDLLGQLAVVEHPLALDALRTFLRERSWGISGVAAITLLAEGDEAALDLIRTLLDDPESQVRAQAAIALAVWGKDPSAISTLVDLYPEADRKLKIVLLEGLGHIGGREALPLLLNALQDPFPTLRIIAASSIIQCLNS